MTFFWKIEFPSRYDVYNWLEYVQRIVSNRRELNADGTNIMLTSHFTVSLKLQAMTRYYNYWPEKRASDVIRQDSDTD